MKPITGLIIAVVFIVGCLAGSTVSSFVVPKVRAGTNPQKWEYLCIEDGDLKNIAAKANKAGREGWEMAAGGGAAITVFCLKRPLP